MGKKSLKLAVIRFARAVVLMLVCYSFEFPETFASSSPTLVPSQIENSQPTSIANSQVSLVIVKYKSSAATYDIHNGERARHLGRQMGVKIEHGRSLGERVQALRGFEISITELVRRLEKNPDVEWVVADEVKRYRSLPNDPLLLGGQSATKPTVGQWYLRPPDALAVSAINALEAWTITTGNPDLTVAVLDTGVILSHPDLSGKLRPGYDFVSPVLYAIDGSGRDADPSDPGDWTQASFCSPGDPAQVSSWHGTKVASLIGASTNNGFGMASVGFNISVSPIRVLGRCGGLDSDIIAAMYWAAGLSSDVGLGDQGSRPNPYPARVMNLSFGSPGPCSVAYRDAIQRLTKEGIVVVAAAGNDAGMPVNTPANCPGVIAVAGLRHTGTKVGYSNLGPEVTIAAPAGNCVNVAGECLYPLIAATNNGKTSPLDSVFSDSTNPTVGTSFSAPLVAGTVALMLSANPSLTVSEIVTMLRQSARPFQTSGAALSVVTCTRPNAIEQLECYCTTSTCGAGMLDAAGAVTLASQGLKQSNPQIEVSSSSLAEETIATPVETRGGAGNVSTLMIIALLIASFVVISIRIIHLRLLPR